MNSRFFVRILAIILLALAFLCALVFFQVRETEQVVITRFGQPVRVISEAGLYLKWPWPIDSVNRVDTRLRFQEVRLSEALTRDRRNLIVPVFLAWKVEDPLKFLEAMGSIDNAENKLDSLAASAENTLLGNYDFRQLVSSNADEVKLGEIENSLTAMVDERARSSFGIRVAQIGIERVTLPEANTAAVFDRMRAERSQFAEQYLAEGRRQADAIRAKTDAQRTVILAEAQKDSEMKRGQAEAEAARIYGQAHSQSPDLYLFLRQIDTLKRTINQNTTLILDANAPPFELLKAGSGAATDESDDEAKKK